MSLKINSDDSFKQNYFKPSEIAQTAPLPNLFYELLIGTLSQLHKADINALSLSCKTLYRAANDHGLWNTLFQRDFPNRLPAPPLPIHWKEQYRQLSCCYTNLKKGNFLVTPLKLHTSAIKTVNSTSDLIITSSSNGIHIVNKSDVTQTFQQLSLCENGEFCINQEQELLIHHPKGYLKIFKKMENGTFHENQSLGDGTPITQFNFDRNHLFYLTNNRTLECFKKDAKEIFQKIGSFEDAYRALHKEGYLFTITAEESIGILKEDEKGIFKKLQPLIKQEWTRGRFSWISYERDHLICGKVSGTIKIFKKNENGIFIDFQSFGVSPVFNLVSAFKTKDDIICCGLSRGEVVISKKQENGEFKISQTLNQHKERISAIEWDGYLLVGSTDSTVSVWQQDAAGDFQLIQTLSDPKHIEGVTALKIEGNQFLVGYGDGSVKIWDFSK